MTVPTITEMREALATVIDTVPGIRGAPAWPERPNPPVAIVAGPDVDYNEDTQSDRYTFAVIVLVSDSVTRAATLLLDSFLAGAGASSIRAALEADDTLGGVVQYLVVTAIRDYGTQVVQSTEYLGATLMVEAVAYR